MATPGKSFGKVLGKLMRKKRTTSKELESGSTAADDEDATRGDQVPLTELALYNMKDIFVTDKQAKESLLKVYWQVIQMVSDLPKELSTLLDRLYGDVSSKLIENAAGVSEKCKIVVTGESNSGMNNVINTVLGTEVLPYPHVISPGTICCVHTIPSGAEGYFVIQMANGSSEKHVFPKECCTFQCLLSDVIKGKTSQRIETYCHLPVFGNTESVTIVTIPGEDKIISKQFMESVADSSVLIYVINSACPDDVQENKLMQLCKQLQSDTRLNNLNSFDAKCIMFVCNNWEIVEKKESSDPGAEKKIWKEVVTKIKKYFPGISEHDQIYKLRTNETSRSRVSGTLMSDLLKKVYERLRNIIRASQEGKLKKHYSWLDSMLQHVRKHALVRIQFANDDIKSNDDVRQPFKKLQRFISESTKMKNDLKQQAFSRCTQMVVLLETHLKQTTVQSDIKSRFYANISMPLSAYDIDETRAEVKRYIQGLILEEIQKLEQDTKHYQRTVTMINEEFEKKFQSLREEFEDVERLVHIENEPDIKVEADGIEAEYTLQTGGKVFIAMTAPIWIPLGIVAALVAIPIVFGAHANDERKLKEFRKDRSPFMDKWLKESLNEFLKRKSIDKCVFENYITILMKRIDQMSARIVSTSMQADMVHLESILKDKRESSEIVSEFTDIKTAVQDHIASLRLFELQYLANDNVNYLDITRIKEIGTGHFSEVYAAKYLHTDVALKVIKTSPTTMFTHLVDLEIFRRLHHEHIVRFKGACYTDMLPAVVGGGKHEKLSSFRLLFLFEKCDTNLEDYVFNNPKLQCGLVPNMPQEARAHATDFFGRTGKAVCSAILYIHGRGYAHRKIHLRGVLLHNGITKLCGPTCKIDTSINDGSRFLAPEVVVQGNIGKHTDIFDLGTLMWELWYGRRAAVDLKKVRSITCRPNPDCNTKQAMPESLARVVQSCWAQNQEERPDPSLLLKEMFPIM